MQLIAKKKGMTSVFTEDGRYEAVTVLEVGPCPIVQVKTPEKDGYAAVQMAFVGDKKKKNTTKPLAGHLKKANVEAAEELSEMRVDDLTDFEVGKVLSVADLDEKRPITVVGDSKGRGFAGGVKRYGFRGGDASHGEEKHHRTNGSLGSSARTTHVWKGKRMSGHMGVERKTIKNLEIIKIDAEKNLLIVRGSVPGYSGSTLQVIQK